MKKVYIIPNTLVVKVETQQMIAESAQVFDEGKSYNQSLSRDNDSDWDED